MANGPEFPHFASLGWVLVVGVSSYIATLAICQHWLRFSKRRWKQLDYVWLSFALLGLVGAVSSARRLVAPGLVEWRSAVMVSSADNVRWSARFLSDVSFCRVFSPGLLSEEARSRLQREHNAVCDFGRLVDSLVKDSIPVALSERIRTVRPRPSNPELNKWIVELEDRLSEHTGARERLNAARAALQPTTFEFIVTIFSPMLIAVALGLRFAKVTGELRADSSVS